MMIFRSLVCTLGTTLRALLTVRPQHQNSRWHGLCLMSGPHWLPSMLNLPQADVMQRRPPDYGNSYAVYYRQNPTLQAANESHLYTTSTFPAQIVSLGTTNGSLSGTFRLRYEDQATSPLQVNASSEAVEVGNAPTMLVLNTRCVHLSPYTKSG